MQAPNSNYRKIFPAKHNKEKGGASLRRYPKKGGQFAIIPVELLYEDAVPPSAKLLYGEIYRLSDAGGWCDASNKDFMDLLNCSDSTVRNLLKALEDIGQIRIETKPKRTGKGGTTRRIFCGRRLASHAPSEVPAKKCGHHSQTPAAQAETPQEVPAENCGTRKNLRGVPVKNCGYTPCLLNNINNPPIVPQEISNLISAYAEQDQELSQAIIGLLENRVAVFGPKKAVKTTQALNGILWELDNLSGGDRAQKLRLLQKAINSNWLTVYPPKSEAAPRPPNTPRTRRYVRTEIIDGEEVDVYE